MTTIALRRFDGTALLDRVRVARTFSQRLLGLLGQEGLAPGEGLLIVPCNSVHTCFMRYPIDVAFMDCRGVVLALAQNLRPWRVRACWGAWAALELPAGSIGRMSIVPGDRFDLGGIGCGLLSP